MNTKPFTILQVYCNKHYIPHTIKEFLFTLLSISNGEKEFFATDTNLSQWSGLSTKTFLRHQQELNSWQEDNFTIVNMETYDKLKGIGTFYTFLFLSDLDKIKRQKVLSKIRKVK